MTNDKFNELSELPVLEYDEDEGDDEPPICRLLGPCLYDKAQDMGPDTPPPVSFLTPLELKKRIIKRKEIIQTSRVK